MRLIGVVLLLVVIGSIAVAFSVRLTAEDESFPPVVVRRGTLVKTAVASGRIEPQYEVTVRSQFSGLVGERFASLGDYVDVGDPLVDVRREATALAMIQAQRSVEAAKRGEEAAREYTSGDHLAAYLMRLAFGSKQLERMGEEAELGRRQAEEQLEMLEAGKVRVGDEILDTIVRAPVAGHVIDLIATPGERVMPIGSFQAPTQMATIADMNRFEFRGTVDEIDVGKLESGMLAQISIGALPDVRIEGRVADVGLKAKTVANATMFDVWIDFTPPEDVVIRAGYSATAEILIDRRENVLVLPERVIDFRDGLAMVRTVAKDGAIREQRIEVGVSDGLTIEVRSGLAEGERVLERVVEQNP
jgi:HlyD family secretion protein